MWNSTIKRIESFAGLNKLYLSKGGRANFIKSTLSSLLACLLSLFSIPVSVANRLEKT